MAKKERSPINVSKWGSRGCDTSIIPSSKSIVEDVRIVWALFILGTMIAFALSLVSGRPEVMFFCTTVLMFTCIALVYNSKILNSFVISNLSLYIILIIGAFVLRDPDQTRGIIAIVFHAINLSLVSFVTYKRWKESYPIFIFAFSFVAIAYVIQFTMFINPVFIDPYFARADWTFAVILLAANAVSAYITYLRQQRLCKKLRAMK
jgi:hypothetical protein